MVAIIIVIVAVIVLLLLLLLFMGRQTIDASADKNGTITPDGKIRVRRNANKTFEIKPNAGYQISDVQVDGKSVEAKSTYTFENVKENHTISATFTTTTEQPAGKNKKT